MAGQVTAEYVLKSLIAGFTITQIADSLGVTPSAVEQCIGENDLRSKVAEENLRTNSMYAQIDEALNNGELLAATKLAKVVAYETNPTKLAIILRTLNSAKRRSMTNGAAANQPQVLVEINLPEHLEHNFTFNSAQQAVSIDGRNLVSMDVANLPKLVERPRELELAYEPDTYPEALPGGRHRVGDIL